jgi:hypothetical protein
MGAEALAWSTAGPGRSAADEVGLGAWDVDL